MNDRLTELTCLYLDGVITDEQFAELDAMLAADAEAARTFRVMSEQARLLTEPLRDRVVKLAAEARESKATAGEPARLRLGRAAGWSMAAAIAIIGAAVAAWLAATSSSATVDSRPSDAAPVATIIGVEHGAWGSASASLNAGDDVAPQTIGIDGGQMELLLRSGATVTLTGPSELRLDTPMRVAMTRGQATFDCPPAAAGFTVDLPHGARVIDLGTSFRVIVHPDEPTRVTVTHGRVEVHRPDAAPIVLSAGQTLRIGDAHAWTVLALSADAAHSSPAGFRGSVAATLTDAFDYDPISPTSALPPIGSHDTVNWYAGGGPPGSVLHLSYTLAPTTLVPGQTLAIDLYGRNLPAAFDRDDDFDVELYHGGYSADQRVATAASLAIPDTAPHHLRIDSGDFDADLTGRTFDRIRIVARDSSSPRDPNYFTLVELRALTLPTDTTDTPDLTPRNEPADRSAATPAVDGPPRNRSFDPNRGDLQK